MASLVKFKINFSFTESQNLISGFYGSIGILLEEISITDGENHFKNIYKVFFEGEKIWLQKEEFEIIDC